MAWTAVYTQNTDNPGLGAVSATDADSGFTYARQVKTGSAPDCSAFATEAKSALQKFLTQQAAASDAQNAATTAILKELNS